MSTWEVYNVDKNARDKNKLTKNLSDVEKEGANLWANPDVNSSSEGEENMALDSPQDSIDKSEDSKVKSFDLNCIYALQLFSTLGLSFGIASGM